MSFTNQDCSQCMGQGTMRDLQTIRPNNSPDFNTTISRVLCTRCGGSGKEPITLPCPTCKGKAYITTPGESNVRAWKSASDLTMPAGFMEPCVACNQSGKMIIDTSRIDAPRHLPLSPGVYSLAIGYTSFYSPTSTVIQEAVACRDSWIDLSKSVGHITVRETEILVKSILVLQKASWGVLFETSTPRPFVAKIFENPRPPPAQNPYVMVRGTVTSRSPSETFVPIKFNPIKFEMATDCLDYFKREYPAHESNLEE